MFYISLPRFSFTQNVQIWNDNFIIDALQEICIVMNEFVINFKSYISHMIFIMSSCLGQVVKDRTWHIVAWHPIAMTVTSSMRLD
jgi:hypothetical protein